MRSIAGARAVGRPASQAKQTRLHKHTSKNRSPIAAHKPSPVAGVIHSGRVA